MLIPGTIQKDLFISIERNTSKKKFHLGVGCSYDVRMNGRIDIEPRIESPVLFILAGWFWRIRFIIYFMYVLVTNNKTVFSYDKSVYFFRSYVWDIEYQPVLK